MAKPYQYGLKIWQCTLTGQLCDLGGRCDECEVAFEQQQINEIVKSIEEENNKS